MLDLNAIVSKKKIPQVIRVTIFRVDPVAKGGKTRAAMAGFLLGNTSNQPSVLSCSYS
jgi:hypothetical protein